MRKTTTHTPKPTATKSEPRSVVKLTRCAIYTRKSSEEGLEQEFNSLDAQRDAGEAFVRSQAGEGWVILPERYDDGGYTGGNTAALEAEASGLERDLKVWHGEVRRLSVQLRPGEDNGELVGRLADLHERIGTVETKVKRVRSNIATATSQLIPEEEATQALSAFDPVWQSLTPREQGRVIDLLVERVDYDGEAGTVAVTFRPAGIKTLADELAQEQLEQREKRA